MRFVGMLVALVSLVAAVPVAATEHPAQAIPALLESSPHTERAAPSADAGLRRSREARLRAIEWASADRLALPLFDGAEFVATKLAAHSTESVWVGALDGVPHGLAAFARQRDQLSGVVLADGIEYRITSDGSDALVVETSPWNGTTPGEPVAAGAASFAGEPSSSNQPAAITGSAYVDLLVVYTPLVRSRAGSHDAVVATLEAHVAMTNVAYENSGIAQRLRLIGAEQVAYSETGDGVEDLWAVSDPYDGVLDGVHTRRNDLKADLVTFMLADLGPGLGGLAWINETNDIEYAKAFGFNVVVDDCGFVCLAHELGHNMGGAHDYDNAFNFGYFTYSFGYRVPGDFHTIMAYPCSVNGLESCELIPNFSNPDVTYNGMPTGLAIGNPFPTEAHNAETFDLTAAWVSRFGDFTDTHGNRFTEDILWLAREGITKGCNPPANDRYCPDRPVTRGQMAAFMVRALGLTESGSTDFVDDDGSIFEADIEKLAAAGITKGCNPPVNDRFCPDRSVTRGQMAAFMVRALDLTDPGSTDFVDDDGSIFEADIEKLAAAGITKGCNPPVNDRFCPDNPVTREQMAAFMFRALGD